MRSSYGERETVGSLSVKARTNPEKIQVGDMSRELMPQLVKDLNDTIESNPYDGRPFYIIIHEKKDLLLKNVLLRRMITTEKRPYPEPQTSVFWTDPKACVVKFCWSLPHQTHFDNILANAKNYPKEQIKDILCYKFERMENFGFTKLGETVDKTPIYIPIPNFRDRDLPNQRPKKQ